MAKRSQPEPAKCKTLASKKSPAAPKKPVKPESKVVRGRNSREKVETPPSKTRSGRTTKTNVEPVHDDEMPPRRKYPRRAKVEADSFFEVLSAYEELKVNAKKNTRPTKKTKEKGAHVESSDTDDDLVNEKHEHPISVVFSEDEEAETMSNVINSYGKCIEPDQYPKLQDLWQSIVKDMSMDFVQRYFEIIKKMLMGRISSLQPIVSQVSDFPKDMLKVHDEFFRLISEMSGVYPYNYHEGTKLVSKHFVGGVSEIGAVSLLCCLMHGVMPLDLNLNQPAITRISTIIRTEIKDALEAAVEDNPKQVLTKSRVKIPEVQL